MFVPGAIFVEQADGHYRIRLRSKGPVINELAKKHDGGGHRWLVVLRPRTRRRSSKVIAELDQRQK